MNNEDVNYLDGHHDPKFVDMRLGQRIQEPDKCWMEGTETTIFVGLNNEAHEGREISRSREMPNNIAINLPNEDFITLQEISDKWGTTEVEFQGKKEKYRQLILVIAEAPLSGAIYRYGNHGDYWELVGRMCGYA